MTIEQLMMDTIDMHVHCEPDPMGESRVGSLQLAQQAKEAGMKAVVIKNNLCGTGPIACTVNRVVNSPILVGSLVLNRAAGGLNPDVVEGQAQAGAKVIWMPTMSAAAHIKSRAGRKGHGTDTDEGISIVDKDGKLVPQMGGILDVIKRNKLVLATGHISIAEAFAAAGAALRQQVKVIITHPMARPFGPALSVEQARELVSMGAYIEFVFAHCMPPMLLSPENMVGYLKAIGTEHCVLSTDFGQSFNPPPTEGFRMMLAILLRSGLSEEELKIMAGVNPARILGLD